LSPEGEKFKKGPPTCGSRPSNCGPTGRKKNPPKGQIRRAGFRKAFFRSGSYAGAPGFLLREDFFPPVEKRARNSRRGSKLHKRGGELGTKNWLKARRRWPKSSKKTRFLRSPAHDFSGGGGRSGERGAGEPSGRSSRTGQWPFNRKSQKPRHRPPKKKHPFGPAFAAGKRNVKTPRF